MAPGSAFLKALVLDEAKHGTVATYTFGGTSTALVRVRDWAFTAGSALPQRHGSPAKVQFHRETVPQPVISAADGVPDLAALAPEVRMGEGDLLVADEASRLPWENAHLTNALSHADALTSPLLQQQVRLILEQIR